MPLYGVGVVGEADGADVAEPMGEGGLGAVGAGPGDVD